MGTRTLLGITAKPADYSGPLRASPARERVSLVNHGEKQMNRLPRFVNSSRLEKKKALAQGAKAFDLNKICFA